MLNPFVVQAVYHLLLNQEDWSTAEEIGEAQEGTVLELNDGAMCYMLREMIMGGAVDSRMFEGELKYKARQ